MEWDSVLGSCRSAMTLPSEARIVHGEALSLAPLREDVWRSLMTVEVSAGNVARALDVYERCRVHLAERLGTDPSGATQDLHAKVLRSSSSRRADPLRDAGPSTPHDGRTASSSSCDAAQIALARARKSSVAIASEAAVVGGWVGAADCVAANGSAVAAVSVSLAYPARALQAAVTMTRRCGPRSWARLVRMPCSLCRSRCHRHPPAARNPQDING